MLCRTRRERLSKVVFTYIALDVIKRETQIKMITLDVSCFVSKMANPSTLSVGRVDVNSDMHIRVVAKLKKLHENITEVMEILREGSKNPGYYEIFGAESLFRIDTMQYFNSPLDLYAEVARHVMQGTNDFKHHTMQFEWKKTKMEHRADLYEQYFITRFTNVSTPDVNTQWIYLIVDVKCISKGHQYRMMMFGLNFYCSSDLPWGVEWDKLNPLHSH